ncbi:MAG: GFA family protein [Myxococcota bacterium]
MIAGSCLCGAVRYEATTRAGPMGACHCTMCRKAHGSAFSSVQPVARDGFRFTAGESELRAYESSPGKRRWFCGRCGSPIVSTRDADDATLLLRAGCVDDGLAEGPVAHGWVGSKAPWYEIADALPRFERGFPGAPPGVRE